MRTSILTIALFFTTLFSLAQKGVTITVTINNVQNNKGTVSMALHTEDTFMKAAPIQGKKSEISDTPPRPDATTCAAIASPR